MLINEVAKKYNITIRSLRYYEELGLLASSRTESNIRTFDDVQVLKLEQILVYKMLNFSLSDIKTILESSNNEILNTKLHNMLASIEKDIIDLTYKQQLLFSLLNTFGSNDISKQTVQEFINEQIYFKNNNERLINMLANTKNLIIEIGKDLIPIAMNDSSPSLISSIKSLRQDLLKSHSIELDTIRVRDNPTDLEPNEYQILQNNNMLIKNLITADSKALQVEHIITSLKSLLL